jgi:uncharacterized protein YqgQ
VSQEQGCEFLPLSAIRTETVLSRFPIHNLAKTGRIDIYIKKQNEKGEVDLYWDVSYSDKHGQARQLAYKLDTLIINRRIEEAGRPIPRIIRLGALKEICRELGLSESGDSTNRIKKALHQNSSTYLTAKLKYKGMDGMEKTLEVSDTRYGVIFTGEKLPDGRKADAVYLSPHDFYREILNTAPFRPLDYEYLKALSPSAQRCYEIVSYRMFPAVKHKNPTAKLLYSEYCMYSGQECYVEREKARKQMWKLHQPHLKSGYFAEARFENISNHEGEPDWMLVYVPGKKALDEYKAFSQKQKRLIDVVVDSEITVEKALQPEHPEGQSRPVPTLTDEQKHFAKELVERFNVHEDTAIKLVTTKLEQVAHQLEVYPHRQHSRIKDPAAYIIRAIEQNYSPPTRYQEQKAQKKRKEEETKVKDLEQARRGHQEAYYGAWIHYLGEREDEIKKTLQEVHKTFKQHSVMERKQFASSSKPKIREMQEKVYDRTDSHLNRFYKYFAEYPGCEVLDFWTWDRRINPNPFER